MTERQQKHFRNSAESFVNLGRRSGIEGRKLLNAPPLRLLTFRIAFGNRSRPTTACRNQLELRMQFGSGRMPDDSLLFTDIEGGPIEPWAVSSDWGDFADEADMPGVTFHALRHTHANQLITRGVDIVTVSKRLGHAKPEITLRVYAHLFTKDDSTAAAAINAAMAVVS
jgi:integrase